jgi:hypothetical protein
VRDQLHRDVAARFGCFNPRRETSVGKLCWVQKFTKNLVVGAGAKTVNCTVAGCLDYEKLLARGIAGEDATMTNEEAVCTRRCLCRCCLKIVVIPTLSHHTLVIFSPSNSVLPTTQHIRLGIGWDNDTNFVVSRKYDQEVRPTSESLCVHS